MNASSRQWRSSRKLATLDSLSKFQQHLATRHHMRRRSRQICMRTIDESPEIANASSSTYSKHQTNTDVSDNACRQRRTHTASATATCGITHRHSAVIHNGIFIGRSINTYIQQPARQSATSSSSSTPNGPAAGTPNDRGAHQCRNQRQTHHQAALRRAGP